MGGRAKTQTFELKSLTNKAEITMEGHQNEETNALGVASQAPTRRITRSSPTTGAASILSL